MKKNIAAPTSYDSIVAERYHAMAASKDFLTIRKKWLGVLGRRSPFRSFDQWLTSTAKLLDQPHHQEALESDIRFLSDSFALPDWHVRAGLFTESHSLTNTNDNAFPKELRYPRTAVVISGPLTKRLIALGPILYERDINLEWEPAPGPLAHRNKTIMVSVELPMEIPSSEAVAIVRRSRRQAIDALKQARIPIIGCPETDVSISAICYGRIPNLTDSISQAANLAGMQVAFEPHSSSNYQADQPNPNPLSYLRTQIRFSPIVMARDLVVKTRECNRSAREMIRALGLNVGQRLRPSPLTNLASRLLVDGNRLPRRGLGDLILDDMAGFPNESSRPTKEAERLKSTAKSRRNQVLQRFREKGLRS